MRSWCRSFLLAVVLFAGLGAQAQTPLAPVPPAVVPAAAASASPAKDDTPTKNTLSIGPGLFTFPQIAVLLSTPEQPITCDLVLQDRAAFVFLQNRLRVQAKELLGAGLQVEYLPQPPGANGKSNGLLMVRQKAVVEREAQWLRRFARILQTDWQNKIQKTTAFAGSPLPDVDKIKQWEEEAAHLHDEVGYPPYDAPPATDAIAQKRERIQSLIAALQVENTLPNAQQRMLAAWAQANPPAFIPVIQGQRPDEITQPLPPQWLDNGWVKAAILTGIHESTALSLSSPPAGFGPENYDFSAGYLFRWGPRLEVDFSAQWHLHHLSSAASEAVIADANKTLGKNRETLSEPEKQNATAIYYLKRGASAFERISLPRSDVPRPKELPPPLFLLGTDAIAWWTQEQADTDRCLQTLAETAPKTPSAPPIQNEGGPEKVALSDAIGRFAARTGTETVMELHPRLELLQPAGNTPTLASLLHLPGLPDQWSVRERNKVLLITNRLEFMERPQNVPLPEFAPLITNLKAWHDEHDAAFAARYKKDKTNRNSAFIREFLPYEPIAAYARAVFQRQGGRMWDTHDNIPDYHGVNLGTLNSSVPTAYLWGKLTEKERTQLLARLRANTPDADSRFRKARIYLSHFSQGTLHTLTQLLREMGAQDADEANPQFMSQLRASCLYIVLYVDPALTIPGHDALGASLVFENTMFAARELNIRTSLLIDAPTKPDAPP